jgi:hypothetical protein
MSVSAGVPSVRQIPICPSFQSRRKYITMIAKLRFERICEDLTH